MSNLPINNNKGLSKFETWQCERAVRSAELEVFHHALDTTVEVEKDRRTTQGLGSVFGTAIDEEVHLLRHGLNMAGNSAAGVELVSRKVNEFSIINSKRILEKFGG